MEKKRAACYIRVSTDEQAEYSPDSQLREMQEYARRGNIVILNDRIYVDEGISGRKAETRPAFQKMIADAKTKPKPFDMVMLYKFSRFARNREDSVFYKSLLRKKCGIAVISIKEPLDADNKMSVILEAFIEAMDEYYSINLSEDVRRTMTEKAMRGEYQTVPPFGYRMMEKSLVPDKSEAFAVRYIFDLFNSGESYCALAQRLNAMGVRTHRGNLFESRTIAYILKNPVYIGKVRWRPRVPNDSRTIIADSSYEPVINKSVFEKAQCRIKTIESKHNFAYKNESKHKDWLSGLVICSACGKAIVKCGSYWRCSGYAHGTCGKSQYISDAVLKETIFNKLQSDIKQNTYSVGFVLSDDNNNLLLAQLASLRAKLNRMREAYLSGADSLDEYNAGKKSITSEINSLQKQIDSQKSELNSTKNIEKLIENAGSIMYDSSFGAAEKHAAAHSIFSKMVLDNDKNLLTIEYQLLP